MKLTSLGGAENGGVLSPACFSLDLSHSRILLECPIDLSALLWFLPTVLPSKEHGTFGPNPKVNAGSEALRSSSSISSLVGKPNCSETHNQLNDFEECLRIAAKRPRVDAGSSTATFENEFQKRSDWTHHFKDIDGRCYLDTAPYYKTPDYNLIDVSSVNAVIISNPVAMLGLPFLVRNPDFTAKIYATEATAKLGQLMMEELVTLHAEFLQIYGRPTQSAIPAWRLPVLCAGLESSGREQAVGSNGVGENWNCLYSAVDIRVCMAKVHRLHYGEEANIDGCISVKPSSSGFGIGASNWVVKGVNKSISYLSSSVSTTNHAMPLDISSLEGSQVLLFAHGDNMEILQDKHCDVGKKEAVALENIAVEVKVVEGSTSETHLATEGVGTSKQPSLQMSPGLSSSLSPARVGSGVPGGLAHKLSSSSVLSATPEKSVKSGLEESEGAEVSNLLVLDEQIRFICKAVLEAVGNGGSVLIPISLYGMFLELMENVLFHLRANGLEAIPIFFSSPVAEELLAYSNTVPEWLSPARQEKLYAGEPFFGFVDAVKEMRLYVLPGIHSTDLLRNWQEPCIVFATHWSLRMGSAVQLLQRWRKNPLSLLVLTEPNIDQELLLSPFKPLSIQVLCVPVSTNLRSKDVVPIIQKLKPHLTVVPENLKNLGAVLGSTDISLGIISHYRMWETLKIPCFQDKNDREVELSADLALQIQLKQVKSGKVATARLSAELHIKDGQWLLDTVSPQTYYRGYPVTRIPKYQIRWGNVEVDTLLTALKERGMSDLHVTERVEEGSERNAASDGKVVLIKIKSPSQGNIEVTPSRINIHANELSFRRLIVDVVNSVLNVL